MSIILIVRKTVVRSHLPTPTGCILNQQKFSQDFDTSIFILKHAVT